MEYEETGKVHGICFTSSSSSPELIPSISNDISAKAESGSHLISRWYRLKNSNAEGFHFWSWALSRKIGSLNNVLLFRSICSNPPHVSYAVGEYLGYGMSGGKSAKEKDHQQTTHKIGRKITVGLFAD